MSRIAVNQTQALLARRPSLAFIGSLIAWGGPASLSDVLDSIQAYWVLQWYFIGAVLVTAIVGVIDLIRWSPTESRAKPFFLVSSITAICVALFLYLNLVLTGASFFRLAVYSIHLLLTLLGGTLCIMDSRVRRRQEVG